MCRSPCAGVHKRMLLISLFLLFQQGPHVFFVRWEEGFCKDAVQDGPRQSSVVPFKFFCNAFCQCYVLHPYSSMDIATVSLKFRFILLDKSDFRMIDSLSVDAMLLPNYENRSTNFRGLPL